MKESYKQHLQKVLKSGEVKLFRVELHNVIKKEIKAMDVPLLERNAILDILDLIEIPLDVKSCVEYPLKERCNKQVIAVIAASATGVLLNTLLYKTPFMLKSLLSIGGATVAGLLVSGNNDEEKHGVLVETIVTPFDEIVSKVDKLLSIMQGVMTPKKVILSDSFPNILKWYQKAYSSCGEFGEPCSKYFKKRIESILRQNGYTLHNFDGTNDNMFQKTADVEIQTPVQNMPAITNENGYILPGNLFVPKKINNLKE